MTIAIYARVSTNDGRQTVENQLSVLRKKAEEFGGDVVEYIDHASGSRSDRSEFKRLLQDADDGKIQVLLIWAMDRLTREGVLAMLVYLERLKKDGCRVISIQEPWLDTEGMVWEILVSIFSWVSKMERERISSRIKAGLGRARGQGKVLGRPRRHRTSKVLELRKAGMTIREIAKVAGIPRSSVAAMVGKSA